MPPHPMGTSQRDYAGAAAGRAIFHGRDGWCECGWRYDSSAARFSLVFARCTRKAKRARAECWRIFSELLRLVQGGAKGHDTLSTNLGKRASWERSKKNIHSVP